MIRSMVRPSTLVLGWRDGASEAPSRLSPFAPIVKIIAILVVVFLFNLHSIKYPENPVAQRTVSRPFKSTWFQIHSLFRPMLGISPHLTSAVHRVFRGIMSSLELHHYACQWSLCML